jgi:hypothetical protein
MNKWLLLALLGLGAWIAYRRTSALPEGMTRAEAARVLDIPLGASDATVTEAHKRLIARVHPDAGGSVELAARVNQARDVLLSRPN